MKSSKNKRENHTVHASENDGENSNGLADKGSSSIQININGDVSESTIIAGNRNALQDDQKTKSDDLTINEILDTVRLSNSDEWILNVDQDAEIAVFKKIPPIRIETRHSDEFIHNDDFREKWANRFLDPHAISYYYDLYYGATRLRRFILVSVDGGRALLPLPKSAMDLSVELIPYKIALIFDRFDSCRQYMERAGLYPQTLE